jgi:MFS family permease
MKQNFLLKSIYFSNALEFFDYTIFGAFSIVIAQTFFGSHNQHLSEYLTILAFSISLLIRPIGSFIFGTIGDKTSRRQSLRLSILCMTAASISMAILPSYDKIGVLAIIVVFASRILQGISAGGEYNGAAIFAIEEHKNKSWWISGLLTSSAIMGLVLAASFSLTQRIEYLPSWFWRIGFLGGAFMGLSSYFLRSNASIKTTASIPNNFSFKTLYTKHHFYLFLFIFFTGGQTSSLCYWLFMSISEKVITFNTTGIDLIYFKIFYLFIASITSIAAGYYNQKTNNEKNVIPTFLILIFFIPILFYIIQSKSIFILPFTIISILIGMHGAQQHVLFQNYVDQDIRQRFISISFSLGTGILGSLTLIIMKNLNFKQVCFSYFWFSILSIGALLSYLQIRTKQ